MWPRKKNQGKIKYEKKEKNENKEVVVLNSI